MREAVSSSHHRSTKTNCDVYFDPYCRCMVKETFQLAASRHARALGVRIPCENVIVNVSSSFAEMP